MSRRSARPERFRAGLRAEALLAAIVESSDDAIVSKDLSGIVTSWNRGAERLFGYTAAEMIGRPIAVIAAPGHEHEMLAILEKIRNGERVSHYETVRRRKDGTLVDISLTVSPVHDARGRVVGASKIARDIGERKRAEKLQRLLIAELNHRVKNTLAAVQSIAALTYRSSGSREGFYHAFRTRLVALSKAHDLLSAGNWEGTSLRDLLATIVEPYLGGAPTRLRMQGEDIRLHPRAAIPLCLVFHELTTNAAKYGALSVPSGRIEVDWTVTAPSADLRLRWSEVGGPLVSKPNRRGFGSQLIQRSVAHELDGAAAIDYRPEGLICLIQCRIAPETEDSLGAAVAAPT